MEAPLRLRTPDWTAWPLWQWTLAVFVVIGSVVALAEWGLLFREALLVGAPAIVATLLLDTFIYNEFLIRTGESIWLLIYVFLFVQSVIVAAGIRSLVRYWFED